MHFEATELTDEERALQREVRAFLSAELGGATVQPGLGFNSAKDKRLLAAAGGSGLGRHVAARGLRRT